MFVLKKLVSSFFMPYPFFALVMAVALGLLWFSGRQRLGRVLATLAFLGLVASGYQGVTNRVAAGLEAPFATALAPAGGAPPVLTDELRAVKWIVVLGAGSHAAAGEPALAQLTRPSVLRLLEGVRLRKQLPGTRLLLSGGSPFGGYSEAALMKRALDELGIDTSDVALEDTSLDTADEARLVKPMVGTDPLLLVTSAMHMKRSLDLFRRQGLQPLAAPTDRLTSPAGGHFTVFDLFPWPGNLSTLQSSWHEHLGLWWMRLAGMF